MLPEPAIIQLKNCFITGPAKHYFRDESLSTVKGSKRYLSVRVVRLMKHCW
jgi:hypothetical protein